MNNEIREKIFALEFFDPNSESGYGVDAMILNSNEISSLSRTELVDEVNAMESKGLLKKEDDYYRATRLGKIEKQKYLLNSKQRKVAIENQKNFLLSDMILAMAASEKVSFFSEGAICREAFCIYLFDFPPEEVDLAIDELINAGLLMIDPFWIRSFIHITAQGLQQYQREVRQRLHLEMDEGVLDINESVFFDERFNLIGIDDQLVSNMQQRWSEIDKCASTGAYLAAVILLGSVLEGLLLARLQRDIKLAMTSSKAPRNKAAEIKNLNDWSLQDYIAVSVDLGFVPRSVEKHIHELRDTRNLVHPNKQISSNILVDESLYRISKEVAETVIDALLVK